MGITFSQCDYTDTALYEDHFGTTFMTEMDTLKIHGVVQNVLKNPMNDNEIIVTYNEDTKSFKKPMNALTARTVIYDKKTHEYHPIFGDICI